MKKYRKKPVVIEAVKYNKTMSIKDLESRFGLTHTQSLPIKIRIKDLIIETLEGNMRVGDGDYIIRGVQGEFYPCKPDIFEATYEIAE